MPCADSQGFVHQRTLQGIYRSRNTDVDGYTSWLALSPGPVPACRGTYRTGIRTISKRAATAAVRNPGRARGGVMTGRFSFALCLAVAVGCSGSPFLPDVPSQRSQPSPPVLGSSALPQLIQIGEPVDVVIPRVRDGGYNFTLTAPANGRLTARVIWDGANDDFLQIQVGDIMFGAVARNGDEDPDLLPYSTVNGKRSVAGS